MTPDEMKLDMLVAELDYENRLLRARNERLEREAEQRVQAEPKYGMACHWLPSGEIEVVASVERSDGGVHLLARKLMPPSKPWVGLTEDEVEALAIEAGFTTTDLMMVGFCVGVAADLIDSKLREKNQ